MRIFIVLLLLAVTSGISAQQLLFDKTIPEQNVPTASRLKDDIRSHYLNSRYVNQTDFLSQQDFFIAINSNLIVKSKFIKMHSYPSGSFSYEGLLEGPASGYITFSKYNDRTAGMIMLADGSKYMIDQVASNIFVISLSNESAFTQRESHSDFIEIGGPAQRDAATASVCDVSACPGSSTIDMMVVYTQQAENSWGGSANTIANITQAVTNMNISMTNSGINNVTFRLVHTAKVSYTESGDFSTDLVRLAGNGDGYMDNVHSLRDQYGADLVSLIIGSPTSSCGIGYLNTNPSSYSSGNAFNVSLYSCVLGNFTMAHESGHNMGLRHDWYVDASTTPCEHHHGYVNQVALNLGSSSPASARWRTIMAYNDRCSVAGFNCTRVNIWSNPNLTYNGDAMGVHGGNPEPSDEAWAFYRMACLVASFRPEAGGGGGGGGSETCSPPSGLSSSVSTSGATVQWLTVSGAIGYDVDYKLPSSSTWINVSTNTPSIAVGIGGLSSSTVYDWRVRANCSFGSSNYVQSQFTTQAISLPVCNAPASLSTSGITASTATASWAPVNGAASYNVDYKLASSSSWINIANGTTSLSWTISGMQATTSYDWRVRANCTSGSSSYTQTQFTTQALGSCNAPGGLSTSNITSGTATVNWNSVSGAFSYTVEYKPTFSGTWITAASATYSTSVNLYSLSAATTYDWRVRANCSLNESSNYSSAQFATSGSTQLPSSNCPGPYDVSINGTIGGAATIPFNTGINGTISPRSDLDHYKFNITSAGTIIVSLTTLPANYNLSVLNSNGTQIAVSQNNGTQNETLSINVAAGSYYAKVFPKGNANNATSCYTLRVQTGTASDLPVTNNLIVKLFPNPAGSILNVWMEGIAKNTEIKVYDMMGKVVMQQQTTNTLTQINISKLSAGFYLLRVNDGKETKAAKFVKE
ncbi:MAG TPA: T9SS type A sorting domain-containing protein [Chitinophagaceae bacterium]